jgi:hypothetical protein
LFGRQNCEAIHRRRRRAGVQDIAVLASGMHQDQMIPAQAHGRAYGCVREVAASHAVFMTHPGDIAEIIGLAASAIA